MCSCYMALIKDTSTWAILWSWTGPVLSDCTVHWKTTGKEMFLKILPKLRPVSSSWEWEGQGVHIQEYWAASVSQCCQQSLQRWETTSHSLKTGSVGWSLAWCVRCSEFHHNTEYSEQQQEERGSSFHWIGMESGRLQTKGLPVSLNYCTVAHLNKYTKMAR